MLYVTYNSIKIDRQVESCSLKYIHETRLPTLYQNNRWKKKCLVDSIRNASADLTDSSSF